MVRHEDGQSRRVPDRAPSHSGTPRSRQEGVPGTPYIFVLRPLSSRSRTAGVLVHTGSGRRRKGSESEKQGPARRTGTEEESRTPDLSSCHRQVRDSPKKTETETKRQPERFKKTSPDSSRELERRVDGGLSPSADSSSSTLANTPGQEWAGWGWT